MLFFAIPFAASLVMLAYGAGHHDKLLVASGAVTLVLTMVGLFLAMTIAGDLS